MSLPGDDAPESISFLVISIQGWTDMWVSKHWISNALTRDGEVFFLEPFRGVFLPGRGGRIADFFTGPRIRREGAVNVVSMSSLPGHYSGPGWYRALSRFLMRGQLRRFEKKLPAGKRLVLTFGYRSEPFIRQLRNVDRTLYYAIDQIPPELNDPWWPEEGLIRFADEVLTTSRRHRDRLVKAFGRTDIAVVPHGVDFAVAQSGGQARPSDLPTGKAIIGYTGSIHDTYVDFDLIEAAASDRPEWVFVFIGPTKRNELSVGASAKIGQLEQLPNVHFLGPRPYQELASYIAHFDVCIMPYDSSIDNEPFKTLNYFAQGKPVVATDVPGVSEYKHLLYTFADVHGFVASVERALAEPADDDQRQARIDFARAHDFSVVSQQILELFELEPS